MGKGFEASVMSGEPIFLTTFTNEFEMKDAPTIMAQMKAAFDAATEPMYMLDDVRQLRVNFSDVVNGLALSTRGDLGVARHPNVRKIVIVTTSELLKFAGNALKQAQYGGVSVEVFTSMDDALATIRAELQAARV